MRLDLWLITYSHYLSFVFRGPNKWKSTINTTIYTVSSIWYIPFANILHKHGQPKTLWGFCYSSNTQSRHYSMFHLRSQHLSNIIHLYPWCYFLLIQWDGLSKAILFAVRPMFAFLYTVISSGIDRPRWNAKLARTASNRFGQSILIIYII
jgi:hypothetical protein